MSERLPSLLGRRAWRSARTCANRSARGRPDRLATSKSQHMRIMRFSSPKCSKQPWSCSHCPAARAISGPCRAQHRAAPGSFSTHACLPGVKPPHIGLTGSRRVSSLFKCNSIRPPQPHRPPRAQTATAARSRRHCATRWAGPGSSAPRRCTHARLPGSDSARRAQGRSGAG